MTKFTSFFAKETSKKLSVLFLIFGTSFFYSPAAEAVNTGQVTITCANASGVTRTNTVGWDNSNQFFAGKGDIARLYCEGGYAGEYTTFISTTVTDMSLRFYNGVVPEDSSTVVVEPTPSASPIPDSQTAAAETETASSEETSTVVDSSTVATESSTSSADSETVVTQPQESQTVSSETTTTTETQTVNVTPEPPIIPEPTPIVVPEPPVVRPEPIVIPDPPAPLPEPTPEPTPEPEPEPEPVPEVEPEPETEPELPVVEPEPEVVPEPPVEEEPEPLEVEPVEEVEQPEPPVVEEEVNPTPEIVVLTADTDLSELAPETPVQLENGVILTAEVVVALQLLENPAELLAELFSNPAEVFTALSNIGADMSPEVREQSEDVVVAAVIVGNIATQAAATAAGVAAYRRKP